nr:hypothetical protein [Allomuricauda sp.]
MEKTDLIPWLLKGDVSIQYQVYRDLLQQNRNDLQHKIALEGWGKTLLSKRSPTGHWGKRFYEPKWISTHYTLLDLKNLNIAPNIKPIHETLKAIIAEDKAPDGGINPIGSVKLSDICVNGMFLNYASYFKVNPFDLESIVDCIMAEHMSDGGFNCRSNRSGATHSSLHSTTSVLEGFTEYLKNGYTYRADDINKAKKSSIEFILQHRLYLSDRTGEIIKKDFLKFPYPSRWRYDILRALDYLRYEGVSWDNRMKPGFDVLMKKRNADGTWKQYAQYPGKVHVEMEKTGKPSRWNTLRALRVLKHFENSI